MYKYAVGDIVESFKSWQEGVKFDINDGGAVLVILFNKPTEKEIEAIRSGKAEFGLFAKDDVIFLLSKFGNLPWMDSPYHIALSRDLTKLQDIEEGQGYGLNIVLADCSTGEVKVLRYVGLSTAFSKTLKEQIENQDKKNFNPFEYDMKINRIYNTYSTKEMVNYSIANCKIR